MHNIPPLFNCIYKITSPSNKVYIGSTKNLAKRMRYYKDIKVKSQTRVYNSLVKYGVYSHNFEVLEWGLNNCNLYRHEHYWGVLYNVLSATEGLNCNIPRLGEKVLSISEETRIKISETKREYYKNNPGPNLGRKFSEEFKNNMRLSKREYYKNNPGSNLGRKFSEEFKNNMRLSRINYYKNNPGSNLGRKFSEEFKEKQRQIKKEYFKTHASPTKGLVMSEEQKLLISQNRTKNYILDMNTGIFYTARELKELHNRSSYTELVSRLNKYYKSPGRFVYTQ